MIVIQTPLRISLMGGGTDFEEFYLKHGGAVLSAAINKCVFIIIKERFDDMIYINYSKKEIVEKVSDIKHDLVREAMRVTGVDKGVEITTLSDVPADGTGLGTSSSITVGLLQALYSYRGENKAAETLAREACNIEIEYLKKPIGKQDQYIAAYGNTQLITFNKRGIELETIEISPQHKRRLDENLLLFYTGTHRDSSEILFEQRENIHERIEVLLEMKRLVFKAKDSILEGNLDYFGEILHHSWDLKKRLASKITNPKIDEVYKTALRAGAIGGKITGAGGGGFLLLYCPKQRQDNVRSALNDLRELPFHFEPDGSKVIFDYRRTD